MLGVITKRHFFLVLLTLGPRAALRVLFSNERTALKSLIILK